MNFYQTEPIAADERFRRFERRVDALVQPYRFTKISREGSISYRRPRHRPVVFKLFHLNDRTYGYGVQATLVEGNDRLRDLAWDTFALLPATNSPFKGTTFDADEAETEVAVQHIAKILSVLFGEPPTGPNLRQQLDAL